MVFSKVLGGFFLSYHSKLLAKTIDGSGRTLEVME